MSHLRWWERSLIVLALVLVALGTFVNLAMDGL